MKRMTNLMRKTLTLVLVVVFAAGLSSCSQPAQTSAPDDGAPYGSPWVSSVFADNLPDAAPAAAEDL